MMAASKSDRTGGQTALTVLALNCGSSSLKFGLYRAGSSHIETLLSGEAESIGGGGSKFRAHDARGGKWVSDNVLILSQRDAFLRIEKLLAQSKAPAPEAIGHRIVHGGPELRDHCFINDLVLHQLDAAVAFAPLHAPAALSVLRIAQERFPGLPQVACFDTAFHSGLPEVARVLPISKDLQYDGLQRYGFHGLSCESIVRRFGKNLPKRLIIAHLGNGVSVTAVKEGKSIDTSMGLTPTGGVIMGTRSGDLDPGVLLYLMREKRFDAATLEDLVDHRSGLLGISDVDSDMRRLHEAAIANPDARLAIQMFCYCLGKQMAAMISALDGVDQIVFTGGIGENDAQVRAMACAGLSWIGVRLDAARNQSARNPINDSASRCVVQVLASQENDQIARRTWALLPRGSS